jgi:hypothetical protein
MEEQKNQKKNECVFKTQTKATTNMAMVTFKVVVIMKD